ncbi:MAG: hypothetical protein AABY64_00570 [Bdellovibrionota bacterium]
MLNKSFSLLLFLFLLPILSAKGDLSCDKVFLNEHESWQQTVLSLRNSTDLRLKQPFQFRPPSHLRQLNLSFPTQAKAYEDTIFSISHSPTIALPSGTQIYKKIDFGYQKENFRRLANVNYIAVGENGKILEIGVGSKELLTELRSHIFGRALSIEELKVIEEINNKLISDLRKNPEAQKKLKEFAQKRNWPEGLEDVARLAYYSENIISIQQWANSNGYSLAQMRDAGWGLMKFDESGRPFYDIPKEESIKIPYFSSNNQSGIPIWRTRNIEKRDDGKKYIGWQMDRSIDREYAPNETLYNAWNLNKAEGKTIVITEGEFKCLVANQTTGILTLGIPGITQFDNNLAKAIVQAKPKEVIVVLDRDPRGKGLMRTDGITDSQRAAYIIAQQIKQAGFSQVKVGILPDAFDGAKVGIDDLILAKGTEPYLKTLSQAVTPEEYARQISLDPKLNQLQTRFQALSKSWENYHKSKARGGPSLSAKDVGLVNLELQKAKKEYFNYLALHYKGARSLNQASVQFPSIPQLGILPESFPVVATTRKGKSVDAGFFANEVLLMDFVSSDANLASCKPGPCSSFIATRNEVLSLISGSGTATKNPDLLAAFQKGKEIAEQDGFVQKTISDAETVMLAGYLLHDFPRDEYKMEFNVKIRSPIQSHVEELVPLVVYKISNGSTVAMARLRTTPLENDLKNYIFTRIGNYLRP